MLRRVSRGASPSSLWQRPTGSLGVWDRERGSVLGQGSSGTGRKGGCLGLCEFVSFADMRLCAWGPGSGGSWQESRLGQVTWGTGLLAKLFSCRDRRAGTLPGTWGLSPPPEPVGSRAMAFSRGALLISMARSGKADRVGDRVLSGGVWAE